MATEKATYPKIGRRIWLSMRARFAKSIPTTVTPDFVSSIVEMGDASAKANVLSPLRALGILDQDNKPTELAERWRHDDEYKQVCEEIRKAVYPIGLLETYPEGSPDQHEQIKKWFAKNGKVGDSAARMFADTYILLSQADLSAPDNDAAKPRPAKKVSSPAAKAVAKPASKAAQATAISPKEPPDNQHDNKGHSGKGRLPSVHIDVQVHISPDTTPEQIDRIFESMSKHLGTYIA
ncbi:hypothetical protein J2W24_004195 [Variovorax boronicumulans]|uniref:DUF5343 domain-containing protein n=1 Tax=Variovorax boronicumulans TaxID=436515 RepID=UPI00277FC17D|nr:DUF5343 domain-containing protein [Variovorax boronicumulans]MDP9918535.1 hypothetical protein [Variovorax boronicumulans]